MFALTTQYFCLNNMSVNLTTLAEDHCIILIQYFNIFLKTYELGS